MEQAHHSCCAAVLDGYVAVVDEARTHLCLHSAANGRWIETFRLQTHLHPQVPHLRMNDVNREVAVMGALPLLLGETSDCDERGTLFCRCSLWPRLTPLSCIVFATGVWLVLRATPKEEHVHGRSFSHTQLGKLLSSLSAAGPLSCTNIFSLKFRNAAPTSREPLKRLPRKAEVWMLN